MGRKLLNSVVQTYWGADDEGKLGGKEFPGQSKKHDKVLTQDRSCHVWNRHFSYGLCAGWKRISRHEAE